MFSLSIGPITDEHFLEEEGELSRLFIDPVGFSEAIHTSGSGERVVGEG